MERGDRPGRIRPTVAGYAVALVQQHGFDPDVAYLAAHYYVHDRPPRRTPAQVIDLMQRVWHVPRVDGALAEAMLRAYTGRR